MRRNIVCVHLFFIILVYTNKQTHGSLRKKNIYKFKNDEMREEEKEEEKVHSFPSS